MDPQGFLAFANHMPEGMLLADANGNILAANNTATQKLGCLPVDIVNHNISEFTGLGQAEIKSKIAPCTRSRTPVKLSLQCIKIEKTFNCEGFLVTPRSEDQPALVTIRFKSIEDSADTFVGLNREINKQKSLLRKLQLSKEEIDRNNEYLNTMLYSIGDAVISTDAEGRITTMNSTAENLTGWSLNEASLLSINDVFHVVDARTREPLQSPYDRVIESGEVVSLSEHATLLSRDGTEYHISDTAAPIQSKHSHRIQGVVLVFNDISEQYRLRDEAAKSQRDLVAVMEYTPSIIYIKDCDGTYRFVNHRFEAFINTPREEIVGKTDFDLFPDQVAKQFQHNDKAVFDSGTAQESEEIVQSVNGINNFLSIKFPLTDHDGNIYALCGISTDITHRKESEEGLRRAQKMEAIGQLTGGIAHDFNNILGIIMGNIELMEHAVKGDIKMEKRLGNIKKTTQRAAELTKRLLSFSRTSTTEITRVCANRIIQDNLNLFKQSLTPQIEITPRLDDRLWETDINASELEDTLLNLVLNARDAMAGRGCIEITTSNIAITEDDAALHPSYKPGEFIQICVRDDGTGMEEVTLNRIFEPFFTTKEQGKGTGLGLSMVYGFINRSNGFIDVESSPGKGTIIKIYLPRSSAVDTNTILSSDQEQPVSGGHETILVVDDEEALTELAAETLTDLGYRVIVANSAQQALTILDRVPDIDLLFSDVVMPGDTNGFELADKAQSKHPAMKVLLTSGYTEKAASTSTSPNPYPLLSKPYTPKALSYKIRDVIMA